MRIRQFAISALALVAMVSARASADGQHSPAKAFALTRDDGARTMRAILTVQANRPFGAARGYGSLAEVLPVLSTIEGEAKMIDDQTASYGGYTIRLTRSTDRKRFEVALVPQDATCAPSWFSNEQNVIYVGQALGCPAQ